MLDRDTMWEYKSILGQHVSNTSVWMFCPNILAVPDGLQLMCHVILMPPEWRGKIKVTKTVKVAMQRCCCRVICALWMTQRFSGWTNTFFLMSEALDSSLQHDFWTSVSFLALTKSPRQPVCTDCTYSMYIRILHVWILVLEVCIFIRFALSVCRFLVASEGTQKKNDASTHSVCCWWFGFSVSGCAESQRIVGGLPVTSGDAVADREDDSPWQQARDSEMPGRQRHCDSLTNFLKERVRRARKGLGCNVFQFYVKNFEDAALCFVLNMDLID